MTAMLYRAGSDGFQRLLEQRLDELGEAVAGPVEPALDRPQIAAGDVRDLRVALPLELAQHEHGPMVDGELPDALVHGLLEIPLAVEVIRPGGRVLELQRAVVGLPVLLDRLEQHERIAAAVAKLVLGQVRGDRIDPRRELLGLVEPVQVAKYADKHLLHEVFSPLAIADRERAERSEEHTSELQSRPHLVCRLLLEKKKKRYTSRSRPKNKRRFLIEKKDRSTEREHQNRNVCKDQLLRE